MLSKNKKIMLSYNSLNQHTLIIGQSGVGKSVLLKRIYTQLKQQKNTGVFVVHDIKGDFIQQFYNHKTDYILNPLDSRSINLNIFKLIKTKADVKAVVAALIPESKEAKEPIWVNSARDIFESIIYLAIHNYKAGKIEKLDNLVIKDYIQQGIAFLVENFENVKECSRGYAHLQAYKTSSQPANIFSNFLSYMTLFDVVAENKNKELDLKEFIEKQDGATIFLANYNNIKDFVAPLLSLFVNALVRELLSLEENLDRRMFLFLDELTNLLKIDKVLDFLTLARSKGGAAFLGFQDVKALERIYDKEGSETIIANTANKIILRVGDVSTAEYLSKLIGEQEVKIVNKSHSVSPFDRDSVSYSTQIQRRPAVLASQITSLPTLHYFLKTLELQEWTYVPNAFIPAQDKHELKQPKLQLVDTFNINFSSSKIAANFQKMLNMAEEEADEDEQTIL